MRFCGNDEPLEVGPLLLVKRMRAVQVPCTSIPVMRSWGTNSLLFSGRPLGGLVTWQLVERGERPLELGCRVNRAQLGPGEQAGVPELS